MSTPVGGRRNPALDGLRGAAVIGVIAFHAGHLPGGYLGVDLFFVLSGFLITSLLVTEHERNEHIALGAFWIRRARRLMPALLLVLLAVAVFAAFWAGPTQLDELRKGSLSTLFYVANWSAISENHSYWAQYSVPSPLLHTWSLAIEEQFYLVWPLVAVIVMKGRRAVAGSFGWVAHPGTRRLFVVSAAGAVVSAFLLIAGFKQGQDSSRLYYGTDTRAAAVLLGASLACALTIWGPVRGRAARIGIEGIGIAGAVVLGVMWTFVRGESPFLYTGGLLLAGVACLAVIVAIVHPDVGPLARVLSLAPLRGAGLISYGLYLWHWPIFTWFTVQSTGQDGLRLLAAQLGLTVAVSLASYWLLEIPIRRGGIKAVHLRWVAPLTIGVVTMAIFASTMPRGDSDLADPNGGIDRVVATIPRLAPAGVTTGSSVGTTGTNRRPGPLRVLIAGDSVGESLGNAVVPHTAAFGADIVSIAQVGCGVPRANPVIRLPDETELTENPACFTWPDRWAAQVESFQPDVALLVIGWPGQTARLIDGEFRQPCDPGFDRVYAEDTRAALATLGARGARVVGVTAPYYRASAAPEGTDARTDCLNAIYRSAVAATPNASLVDLAGHVCDQAVCQEALDGRTLRPDGLHFEGGPALVIGSWLLQQATKST